MSIPDCPYRSVFIRPSEKATYHCEIGLNFCDVGEDASLCRTCRVPDLLQRIACPYLDLSTVLRPVGEGKWGVKVHLYCEYKQLLSDEDTCITCPIKAPESDPLESAALLYWTKTGITPGAPGLKGGNQTL